MIIVIGASGFIGTYLVDELIRKNYKVLAVGRNKKAESYYKDKGIPFIQLDISKKEDFKKLPKNDVDAVVHLAALIPAANKSLNAKDFLIVNALGTYNTLNYCKENQIKKFIFTSSHFMVEDFWGIWDKKHLKIKEKMGRKFKHAGDHTTYLISKMAAEEYVEYFMQEYGLNCSIFRLSGVWGYGRYQTGFEYFISKARKGESIEVYGNLKKVRDNIYVKDVVRALLLALKKKSANGLFNLSSGVPLTLLQEVQSIVNIFSPKNKLSRIISKPNIIGGIQKSYVYDVSEIKKKIGFSPKYSYEDMLIDYEKEKKAGRFSFLVKNHQ